MTTTEHRQAAKATLAARAKAAGVDPKAGSQPSRESASPYARRGTKIAAASIVSYQAEASRLLRRWLREAELPEDASEFDLREFAGWLVGQKEDLKPSTWRLYRQASIHLLERLPHHDAEAAVALLDADAAGGDPKARHRIIEKRASALKAKAVREADFRRLVRFMRTFSKSPLGPIAADWLVAGATTGLRPSEWRAVEVEEIDNPEGTRTTYLYVANSKTTNGRGNNSPVRTIDVSRLSKEEIACIRRMAARGAAWQEEERYAEMQAEVSRVLHAACPKAGVPAISLYSMRHVATASWKKAGLTREAVSALLGHSTTRCAAQCYGKRRSGWPADIDGLVQPVPEEVATVRARHRLFAKQPLPPATDLGQDEDLDL